jgi:hypothetical protein
VRFSLAFIGSAALAAAIVGCSSGPAATPTLAPGATPAPTQSPGPTAPPVVVGDLCAGLPTFSAEAPAPSFAQDDTLNSRFPTQVDGQPVTSISSAYWVQTACYYGGGASLSGLATVFPAGTVPQISTGSAQVELDDETVYISAFRFPGADPNLIFSHLAEFAAALGGDPADAADSTVTMANLGGKNVYVITDPDGDVSYHYVSGDTVWTVDANTEATAGKVFAAIA